MMENPLAASGTIKLPMLLVAARHTGNKVAPIPPCGFSKFFGLSLSKNWPAPFVWSSCLGFVSLADDIHYTDNNYLCQVIKKGFLLRFITYSTPLALW